MPSALMDLSPGDYHRKQRKMLNPVFSTAHMRNIGNFFFSEPAGGFSSHCSARVLRRRSQGELVLVFIYSRFENVLPLKLRDTLDVKVTEGSQEVTIPGNSTI